MIPGTTPTFFLKLKNTDQCLAKTVSLNIYIRQQDVLITKKNTDNQVTLDTENDIVIVKLSQQESLKFLYKKGNVEFQLHGLFNDGNAWKTYIVQTPINRILSQEVVK